METIKPCPIPESWRKHNDHNPKVIGPISYRYRVLCNSRECIMAGPWAASESLAIAAWNTELHKLAVELAALLKEPQ